MEPYLGEIRIMAFDFNPHNWALCNGQLMSIQQYVALYSLLGTIYGGNGVSTFALPDLRGRIPLHNSYDYVLGQSGGEVSHTLSAAEMPAHNHTWRGSTAVATTGAPAGAVVGAKGRFGRDLLGAANTTLAPASVGSAGGNLAHDNMQPYLTLNFVIALSGVYPPRS